MSKAEAEGRVGQRLNGKWNLVRVLGVGGSAVVYEAIHRNGHPAAVKVMTGLRGRPLELVEHEARLANAVGHPGVVEILDDDVAEDGSPYLVMELLDGETLDERRRRHGGRLALADAATFLEQLLEVLAVAHDRGVIHRDIKPDNVFVRTTGEIKILDFGIAGWRDEPEAATWFGTPGFMPPEQARGDWDAVDARSDLWSAAATFYTIVTARLVHRATSIADLVRAAAREDVDLTPLEALAPARVCDVIERALALDQEDRFPHARGMLHALRSALQTAPPLPALRLPRLVTPLPKCHSMTRVFAGLRRDDADGPCRLRCSMCPICPADVATVRRTA